MQRRREGSGGALQRRDGVCVRAEFDVAESIRKALEAAALRFGGIDIVINTAAIYPTPEPARRSKWSGASTQHQRHEQSRPGAGSRRDSEPQGLAASIVLTSSANAVVPKQGSEPCDVSKAAINHLIRELAIGLGPRFASTASRLQPSLPGPRCSRAIASSCRSKIQDRLLGGRVHRVAALQTG